MIDRLYAAWAVSCILLTAHFIGHIMLKPARHPINSTPLFHLASMIIGIGAIGLLTMLAGISIGYSHYVLKFIFFSSAAGIMTFWIARTKKMTFYHFPEDLDWITKIIFALMCFHFFCYFLTSVSYPYGSDSFSYVLLAQEHLKNGNMDLMLLEPLREIMPIFKAPHLFEMVYVNLLGMSNVISLTIFAKIQFPIALLLSFLIANRMGGRYAGWLTIAILLTEPIIAYFAGESSDNYFISVSFEILCIFFLWLYYRLFKSNLLIFAGVCAGMMVAAKLTTCYYFLALFLFIPLLVHVTRKSQKPVSIFDTELSATMKDSLLFMAPALIIGSTFPLILYLSSGEPIMGLDWTLISIGDKQFQSWIYPFYKMFYNNLLCYNNIFEASPNTPYFLAGAKSLLPYYLINPFKVLSYSNWIFLHTPIALFVGMISPLILIFYKRVGFYTRWLSALLMTAYAAKLFNYPLIIPPKSDMFQIMPSAILFASVVSDSNIGMPKIIKFPIVYNRLRDFILKNIRLPKSALSFTMAILLPFMLINAYNVGTHYSNVIRSYSFENEYQMATKFQQKWFVDNLTEKDVLFGMQTNQVCYIDKPRIIFFYWEAMYYVPWEIIEKRIAETGVTSIYDSSKPVEKLKSYYEKILPVIMVRDPQLFNNLQQVFALYTENFKKKSKFLSENYTKVQDDGTGSIYIRKKGLDLSGRPEKFDSEGPLKMAMGYL